MLSKPQLPTGRTFLMLFLLLSPILLSSVTARHQQYDIDSRCDSDFNVDDRNIVPQHRRCSESVYVRPNNRNRNLILNIYDPLSEFYYYDAIVPVASPQGSSPSGSASVSPSVTSLFVIGTQTITAGGFPITVSGIPISLAPSASAVVVGTSIEVLGPPTPAPVLTIAGTTVTANAASEFVVGTQTIAPGGPPVTISGTFVSLEPSGSTVVIGSSTHALVAAPILTIGGSTFTANAVGQYIINNERLIPGAAPITVSGTTISLAPSATALVIGTSTRALINAAAGPTSTLTLPTQTVVLPVLTLAGSTVTANAQSNYVVAGQTLSAGAPAITVSGTPISLAPSESLLAIGTSTEIVTVTNTLPKPTNRLPAMYPSTGLQLKPLSSSHILLAFLGSALFWGLL
ncbi:hypothetical protein MMC08_003106 [Hypocenomyce scalaris]|nr:hypothetical protein [Hypocenomyce scalaris]